MPRKAGLFVWEPSLLAGVIGAWELVRSPAASFAFESAQLRKYRSYKKLLALGALDGFENYPRNAFLPQFDDLLGLHMAVMEREPAVVLELGGGYSTFIFAHAARTLAGRGRKVAVHSVDQSDHWQEVVRSHMPDRLKAFVRFHRADPKLIDHDGATVSVFESLPVESANFVYVDGGLVEGNKIGADALFLEKRAPPDFAIQVDNRRRTAEFLERNLKRTYNIGAGLNGVQTLFTLKGSRADGAP